LGRRSSASLCLFRGGEAAAARRIARGAYQNVQAVMSPITA
jgi:hypothetical protein